LKQHTYKQNKKGKDRKPSTEDARTAEEGSGDVIKTTPMPERIQQHKEKMALVKPTGSTYCGGPWI